MFVILMKRKSHKTNTTSVEPIVAASYCGSLALFLAAALVPHHNLWAVNWWAYYPSFIAVGLFAVGMLLALGVLRFGAKIDSGDISKPAYHVTSAIVFLAFGILFWILRVETYYLGDGYQLLSRLASDGAIVKPWSYGGIAAPYWLSRLIGDGSQSDVLQAYQFIAVFSGLALVILVLVASRKLFSHFADRLLFLLGVMSGGTSLLFFGYVENYALFVLSVFAFGLLGLLVAREKISRWWLLPLPALAVFCHVFGMILIPATVYLLVANSRSVDWLAGRSKTLKWGASAAILSVLAAAFWYLYTSRYFIRFSFVPFVTNRFTVEGYTLFSFQHMLDWLNLILLFLPGAFILAAVLFRTNRRAVFGRREFRFLLIMLICGLGAVFLLDPKLGMPRDWDLFSFAGVPLILLAFYALLDPERSGGGSRPAAVLMISAGLMVLFPRVYAQTDYDVAVGHLESYFAHDRAKNVAVRTVWIGHLKALGHEDRAVAEMRKMRTESPEIDLADSAWNLVHSGKYREALAGFRRTVELNPMQANSWAGIGNCFSELGQSDSALAYLYISDGLSPYRWVSYNHLAYAYYRLNEYDSAECYWRRALRLDSNLFDPLMGLGTMYARQRRTDQYSEIFFRLAVREDVPVKHVVDQVRTFLQLGEVERGRRAFEIALRRGADSSAIGSLVRDYPELSDLTD